MHPGKAFERRSCQWSIDYIPWLIIATKIIKNINTQNSMSNTFLIITAAFLMAGMNTIETVGYKFRELGVKNSTPSLGYSIHVQTATYARIGSMVALPIMAWLIDNENNIKTIILIPILSSSIFIALTYICNKSEKSGKIIDFIFIKLTKKYSMDISDNAKYRINQPKKIDDSELSKIRQYAYFSYLFIVSGAYISFVIASITPKYRATIIQMAPLITAIGTFISVTYFDPKISHLNETTSEIHNITAAIFDGRILATSSFLIATIIIYYLL